MPVSFSSSLSSEAERLRHNSVLLFPFQLDALANLCPRPFTVLDIPFSCLYWKGRPRPASLDWKNNRELRRFAIAKSCVGGSNRDPRIHYRMRMPRGGSLGRRKEFEVANTLAVARATTAYNGERHLAAIRALPFGGFMASIWIPGASAAIWMPLWFNREHQRELEGRHSEVRRASQGVRRVCRRGWQPAWVFEPSDTHPFLLVITSVHMNFDKCRQRTEAVLYKELSTKVKIVVTLRIYDRTVQSF